MRLFRRATPAPVPDSAYAEHFTGAQTASGHSAANLYPPDAGIRPVIATGAPVDTSVQPGLACRVPGVPRPQGHTVAMTISGEFGIGSRMNGLHSALHNPADVTGHGRPMQELSPVTPATSHRTVPVIDAASSGEQPANRPTQSAGFCR